MSIPELCAHVVALFVGEVFVDCGNAVCPHAFAILIAKEQRALQEVFVVTVDRAADVTVGIGPFARLDVYPLTDETDLRTAIVSFNKSSLGLLVKDRFAG
jgi:hypothetical protein